MMKLNRQETDHLFIDMLIDRYAELLAHYSKVNGALEWYAEKNNTTRNDILDGMEKEDERTAKHR